MNKTLKRIVLISLFALFFVIGGISIFYAQGYRFDTDSLSIKKVGAIYVKTIPGEAQVTLDGEVIDKSYWLFNSGKLIQSLFPKNYELVVSSPGYRTANFSIGVVPSLVSELSHILLIPEKPEVSAEEVYQAEGLLSAEFPLTKKVDQTLYLAGSKVGKYTPVAVSNDGSNILANNKAGLYYIKKTNKGIVEITTTTLALSPKGADYFFDERGNNIISFTEHEIYTLEEKVKPVRLYATTSTISSPAVSSRRIAWLEKSKSTQKIAVYSQANNKTNQYLVPTESKIVKIEWQPNDRILIWDASENIYIYNEGDSTANKISGNVKLAKTSPDGKKIAVAGSDRLELFLENGKYFRTDIPSIGNPEKIVWLQDSGHIILKASAKAYLVDIDTLIPENFQEISTADALWYDTNEDAIYILLNATLNKFKLPA